jgi:hypothetical protein
MKRKMEGEKEGMSGAWREKKKKKRKGKGEKQIWRQSPIK